MPPRRHVAVALLAQRDVDNGTEEVGFAMLAAEALRCWLVFGWCRKWKMETQYEEYGSVGGSGGKVGMGVKSECSGKQSGRWYR